MYLIFAVGIFVYAVHFRFSLLEKLDGNLLEERIGEDILILYSPRLYLLAKLVKLGLERVCGTICYRLFVSDYLLAEVWSDIYGSLAVFAANDTLKFLGDHLIALAADYN